MNIFALAGILVAIFCTFLATIAILSARNKLYVLLTLFNISVALWGAGAYIVGIAQEEQLALLGWKVANLGGYFISIFFYHLVCTFCQIKRRPIILCGYAQAIVFNYLMFIEDKVITKTRFVFGLHYNDGTFLYLLAVVAFLVLVSLSYVELFSFLKRATGEKRTQAIYVIVGFSFGFVLGSGNLLSCFGIDLFYPVGNFGICVYVLVLTYGIFRHRLFDLEAVVQAFQREKLVTIGLIAASINHEIRNPLYAVKGLLETYIDDSESGRERKTPTEVSKKALVQVSRALDVITKLNRFAKPAHEEAKEDSRASISEAIQNVLDLVSYEFELDKIHIKNNLPTNLPPVQADQRQLEEILFNLIVNACHAMSIRKGDRQEGLPVPFSEKGGTLVISASCHSRESGNLDPSPNVLIGDPRLKISRTSLDSRRSDRSVPDDQAANRRLTNWRLKLSGMTCRKHSGMTDKVTITISDTGTSISPEQAKHLFEPFHTTKGEQGTGLGLYITKQLVERTAQNIG